MDIDGYKAKLITILLLCTQGLSACTSHPQRSDELARDAGFTRVVTVGKSFEHVLYEHRLEDPGTRELHIYIEGDGTPWIGGRYPAAEPTARQAVALELMTLDPGPSLYLGRPCYLGLAGSAHCEPELWTSRRYSPEVVASMVEVVQQYLLRYGIQRVVLIGHSGGGTLAALLATRLQAEVFLLTLAANLDTVMWTESKGLLPLSGSLNPLDYRQAIAELPQLHLAGLQDSDVPIAITESFTNALPSSSVKVYPAFDHSCCWREIWPTLLADQPWAVANQGRLSCEPLNQLVPVFD